MLRRSISMSRATIRRPSPRPRLLDVISLARYSALLAQPALRSAIAASVLGPIYDTISKIKA